MTQETVHYVILLTQGTVYFCIAIVWVTSILRKIRESREQTLKHLQRIELTLSQLQRDLEPRDKIPSKY